MSPGSVLALFDFDKTLVSRDSFRLFGALGAGSTLERARLFFYAVIAKLGGLSNARYKELVLERIWLRRSEAERAQLVDALEGEMKALSVDPAWTRLNAHLEKADHIAVLSASPRFYLEGFFREVSSAIEVHGSEVRIEGGRIRVENLYREAKAEAARAIQARVHAERTIVYTDHRDDIPLMRLADHVVLVRPQQTTRQRVQEAGIDFEVLSA